jgi:hypothetical protein
MRSFDCFVGIDWSGDKKPWQKGLKIACARPGSSAPRLIYGRGPKGKWSRTEAIHWIEELVSKQRALIGVDFAFGFPSGDVSLSWEYVEALCRADANFYGGQFFRISDATHSHLVNSPWLPRAGYSAHYLRATEQAAKKTKGATPQSIFNAYGAAQVGPSSISGMRALLSLQHLHRDKISIWPFDDLDDTRSVIVEIFPRYFPLSRNLSSKLSDHGALNAALEAFGSAKVRSAPASEDEGDALLSAAALRSLSDDPTAFEVPPNLAKLEGWIFGVPYPNSASDQELTSEQIAEIERRLADDEPFASDAEVRATFERLTR